jgi:hypothetical protein
MALNHDQQLDVAKFFLTILTDLIKTQDSRKKNMWQSTISNEEANATKDQTQLPLCRADIKILLNAYRKATTATKGFAHTNKLNFHDVTEFIDSYIMEELTPTLKESLDIKSGPANEATPLSISNASDAPWIKINATIAKLQEELPSDDFYERNAEAIELAKKSVITTGIALGIAGVVGLGIFAIVKACSHSDEPTHSPSP